MTTTTAFDVTMPQLGETVSEGTVIDWLVDVGGTIAAGDALLEVSTDKVDTELPSPVSGVLTEIVAVAGETVAVGAVIGRIAVEGGTAVAAPAEAPGDPAAAAARTETQEAPAPTDPPARNHSASLTGSSVATSAGTRLRVSPVAKRLAAEHQIDLADVAGTGPGGAVVKRDITLASELRGTPTSTPVFAGARVASVLDASVRVGLDAVDATGAEHGVAAYVIRALVDTLRAEARQHADLQPLVEPSVTYIHARSGRSVKLRSAAGLRLAGLTSELAAAADSADSRSVEAAVTILDCAELHCSISGAMSGIVSVSIGPRETTPTVSTDSGRVALAFQDVCDIVISVDGSLVSVQALAAIAEGVRQLIETRDWKPEI